SYAVTQPGTFFSHYYLFLLHPLVLLSASMVTVLPTAENNGLASDRGELRKWFAVELTLIVVVIGAIWTSKSESLQAQMLVTLKEPHPVSLRLKELASQESKLAIWGWLPCLYVESQLPQATRDAHTFHLQVESELQDYFIERYIRELASHEDVLLVDVCETGGSYRFTNPRDRHWHTKKIRDYVNQHFVQLETVSGAILYRSR
ncbi:hypothetical protein N9N28_18235, partial [Rubripirellula amarantea]|nr:hypothetical protein [Rubripirellula amarantea]